MEPKGKASATRNYASAGQETTDRALQALGIKGGLGLAVAPFHQDRFRALAFKMSCRAGCNDPVSNSRHAGPSNFIALLGR